MGPGAGGGPGGMPGMMAPGAMGPGMTGMGGMGMGTAGTSWRGPRLHEILDGTSNTILLVEAATPVPWTKPEDLPYVEDQALPRLGGLFDGDLHALFADGSVHFLSRKADETTLRHAIVRNEGQVMDLRKIEAGGGAGAGGGLASELQGLRQQNEDLRRTLDQYRVRSESIREKAALLKQEIDKEKSLERKKALAENEKLRLAVEQSRREMEVMQDLLKQLEQELAELRRKR